MFIHRKKNLPMGRRGHLKFQKLNFTIKLKNVYFRMMKALMPVDKSSWVSLEDKDYGIYKHHSLQCLGIKPDLIESK